MTIYEVITEAGCVVFINKDQAMAYMGKYKLDNPFGWVKYVERVLGSRAPK